MKILFTGGSSFTGYWFVRELAAAGHQVTAVFRGQPSGYEKLRRRRVDELEAVADTRYGVSFGSAAFIDLVCAESGWDLLCHHAADVTDYKSPTFDVIAALANNSREMPAVLSALSERGCSRMLLTGSVFEGGEGAGSDDLPAFSPYGVSKELTARLAAYHTQRAGWHLGKFVIPNPFGPLEEPRFTGYLMRTWFAGEVAGVNTPDYVRDNIHVTLLARSYADFSAGLPAAPGFSHCSPSGYVESQGAFSRRFADEMRSRLGLECELNMARQTEFPEPRVRINTQPPDAEALGWDEDAAWAGLADFYASEFGARAKEHKRASSSCGS